MADDAAQDASPPVRRGRRRAGWLALAAIAAAVLLAAGGAWLARERIADNLIASELERRGIRASYTIERIGAREQILTDIVVGDPSAPDLTIERAVVEVVPRLGIPTLGRIRLVRPRLYGTFIGGELSFGELDPLLFEGEREEAGLPDIDLAIEDARALVEGDLGPVALKLAGEGNLEGGFAGELAATAPQLSAAGCEGQRATLYGRLTTRSGEPHFAGPARFASLRCGEAELGAGAVQLDVGADAALETFDGRAVLALGRVAYPGLSAGAVAGPVRFTWRGGNVTAQYRLEARALAADQVRAERLVLDGSVRSRNGLARHELAGRVEAEGLAAGPALERALAGAQRSGEGTLLEPLLARFRQGLARQLPGSSLAADVDVRLGEGLATLVVPEARLRGGSGETLLSLTRVQYASTAAAPIRLAGNFATGGEGMPRLEGRMNRREGGDTTWRIAMAPYEAGGARMGMPEMVVTQRPDGAIAFAGMVEATGPLPGGRVDGLVLPLSGSLSPAGELAVARGCTEVRFERLHYANLALDGRRLTLCPPRGQAIVRYGAGGLRLAAGAPSLDLAGRLADTPIRIASGPVGFAWPGNVSARRIDVALGPADNAARFAVADLAARIGDEVAGTFSGADVRLAGVPLDLLGAGGSWRYAGGRLVLTDGTLELRDRQVPARFEPLVARGATLQLADNAIAAQAVLREPATGREVTRVDIRHDLTSGRGHADLRVAGLVFDDDLQPAPNCSPTADGTALVRAPGGRPGLSCLAFGVVALVEGTVTGTGRIDWNETSVTSTGRFSSSGLDFAAAFGPVRGASGTVEFTDLLGLTTAPGQVLRVASVNPGLEINDGEVRFRLTGGQVLDVEGGRWPFLGGTLTMHPVTLDFSQAEARRYVFEVEGLEAARFIERMDLSNLSATGTFDGTIPVSFDAEGNGRLDGGLLLSRAPGGNVAYVGALTYEDMGAMANFAFDALKSLDYRQMRVMLDGPLAGEIVTRVRFDGVTQGEGAASNILTRQIARLPIRFDVNVRAPFYRLIANLKSLYDPAAVLDPRSAEVGLLGPDGRPIDRNSPPAAPVQPDPATIQRRESEDMR